MPEGPEKDTKDERPPILGTSEMTAPLSIKEKLKFAADRIQDASGRLSALIQRREKEGLTPLFPPKTERAIWSHGQILTEELKKERVNWDNVSNSLRVLKRTIDSTNDVDRPRAIREDAHSLRGVAQYAEDLGEASRTLARLSAESKEPNFEDSEMAARSLDSRCREFATNLRVVSKKIDGYSRR